jgi:DNA-binding CsgD family transcriptional regulator
MNQQYWGNGLSPFGRDKWKSNVFQNIIRGIEQKGGVMEEAIRLSPREQQIVDLLLQGCGNEEIASQLKMPRRTIKAYFNRLFQRFGIRTGIKRVKLATMLYRRQLWMDGSATETAPQPSASNGLSSLLPKDTRIGKWQKSWEPRNTSSRTISASYTIS